MPYRKFLLLFVFGIVGIGLFQPASASKIPSEFTQQELLSALDLYKGQNPILLCLFHQPFSPTQLYDLLAIYDHPIKELTADIPLANGHSSSIRVHLFRKSSQEVIFSNKWIDSAEKINVHLQGGLSKPPYIFTSVDLHLGYDKFSITDCVVLPAAIDQLKCGSYLQ